MPVIWQAQYWISSFFVTKISLFGFSYKRLPEPRSALMKDLYLSNKALNNTWLPYEKEKNIIQTLSNATFCIYLTTTYLNCIL